jgi:FkbM family methyltransferase
VAAELEPLKKYGLGSRNSRNFEELIARDFFQDKRDGVFLDVGANHHAEDNNTYYLEKVLGWSGVAVEPLSEFAAGYAANRPRTRFVAMFASDVKDQTVTLFVPPDDDKSASGTKHGDDHEKDTERTVPTTTLTHVLEQAGISRIDYLSMDIELAEPKALAGFDLARFRPALVCIESHPEVRQQILDYFTSRGYVLVGKYLRVDPHNLYFTPLVR